MAASPHHNHPSGSHWPDADDTEELRQQTSHILLEQRHLRAELGKFRSAMQRLMAHFGIEYAPATDDLGQQISRIVLDQSRLREEDLGVIRSGMEFLRDEFGHLRSEMQRLMAHVGLENGPQHPTDDLRQQILQSLLEQRQPQLRDDVAEVTCLMERLFQDIREIRYAMQTLTGHFRKRYI